MFLFILLILSNPSVPIPSNKTPSPLPLFFAEPLTRQAFHVAHEVPASLNRLTMPMVLCTNADLVNRVGKGWVGADISD